MNSGSELRGLIWAPHHKQPPGRIRGRGWAKLETRPVILYGLLCLNMLLLLIHVQQLLQRVIQR